MKTKTKKPVFICSVCNGKEYTVVDALTHFCDFEEEVV